MAVRKRTDDCERGEYGRSGGSETRVCWEMLSFEGTWITASAILKLREAVILNRKPDEEHNTSKIEIQPRHGGKD